MCLDARLLPHKLVNMNMNQNDKVFQNFELNFQREKEHMWGPHVLDTIFFLLKFKLNIVIKKIAEYWSYRLNMSLRKI